MNYKTMIKKSVTRVAACIAIIMGSVLTSQAQSIVPLSLPPPPLPETGTVNAVTGDVKTNYELSLNGTYSYQHFYQDGSSGQTYKGGMAIKVNTLSDLNPKWAWLGGSLALNVSSDEVKSQNSVVTKTVQGFDTSETLDFYLPRMSDGLAKYFPAIISPFVSYSGINSDSTPGTKTAFTESSGWEFGVNGQIPVGKLFDFHDGYALNVIGGYAYNNQLSENLLSGGLTETYASDTDLGLQFQINNFWRSFSWSVSATWLHDINFSSAPGENTAYEDYARFATQLSYKPVAWFKLNAGYQYVAFNTISYTHTATMSATFIF
jgi:hypothetical protein